MNRLKRDDDFYTLDAWKECVNEGFIMSSDGHGYWVLSDGRYDDDSFGGDDSIFDFGSDMPFGTIGVVWFNK